MCEFCQQHGEGRKWGCGICRAHCNKNAIKLQDRGNLALTANLW